MSDTFDTTKGVSMLGQGCGAGSLDNAGHIATFTVVAAIGYYLGARFGLLLTLTSADVSSFWPPNAFLLGVLLVAPRRHWWIILCATLPAHLLAQAGVPLSVMSIQFAGNIGQALLAALLFQTIAGDAIRFDRVRIMGSFITICAILVPAFVALLVAGAFDATGWKDDLWLTWQTRFLSNAIATLTITPLVVLAWNRAGASLKDFSIRRAMETGVLAICLVAAGGVIATQANAQPSLTLLYLPIPFLILATVRLGLAGACLSVLVLGVMMVWSALHGHWPLSPRPPVARALDLSLFLIVVTIPLLMLAALLAERSRAHQKIREGEGDLRRLMETTAAIPWQAESGTRRFTYVGPQAAAFLGYPIERWYEDEFWRDRLHPDDKGAVDTLDARIRDATEDFEMDCRMVGASGETVWVHNIVKCEYSNGEPPRLRGFMIDITGRKRAELEAQRHRAELARANRIATMGEFTAVVTHEILQPLSAVLNSAEAAELFLAADPPAMDSVREMLADIRKDDQRAVDIVRGMRRFFQNNELARIPLDMNELLEATLCLVKAEAEARRITVRFDRPETLPRVSGDWIHLQQVVLNLVLNAFEAMSELPERSRCLVARTETGLDGEVIIGISDNGPGLAADQLSKVFDPFRTGKADGLGLGLPISHTLVDAHGGRIWARNNADAGVTFFVALPALGGATT